MNKIINAKNSDKKAQNQLFSNVIRSFNSL